MAQTLKGTAPTFYNVAQDRTSVLDQTFEMNDETGAMHTYRTDIETLRLIGNIHPDAVKKNDFSAVIAIMLLGQMTGQIVKV